MSTADEISNSELRSRIRERERSRATQREAVGQAVLAARKRHQQLRTELEQAAAAELLALAAAVRVCGAADEVTTITGVPRGEVTKAARHVPTSQADTEAQRITDQSAQRRETERRRHRKTQTSPQSSAATSAGTPEGGDEVSPESRRHQL